MTVGEWLEWVKADALRRGLTDLSGPLDALAQATERLRAADWNDDADKDTPVDAALGGTRELPEAK
jgi:hypothetical protein